LSRLAPLDKALVLILVPLWVVCFSLGVKTQIRGGGAAQLEVSLEVPGGYPALTGEYSGFIHRSDPLAAAGLRAGDRVIRIGDADLRGVGTPLGFVARTVEQSAGGKLRLPLVYERDGVRGEASLELISLSLTRAHLTGAFALAASALFLLLRARPTPSVRAWFRFGMCAAFGAAVFAGSRLQIYAFMSIWVVSFTLYFPALFHFLFRFPDDRAPKSRWHRVWPWFLGLPFGGFLLHQFEQAGIILKVDRPLSDALAGEIHAPVRLNSRRDEWKAAVLGEVPNDTEVAGGAGERFSLLLQREEPIDEGAVVGVVAQVVMRVKLAVLG